MRPAPPPAEVPRALTTAGGRPRADACVREFDRQVATLLDRGYPAAAGRSREAFADLLQPLRAAAAQLDSGSDLESGKAEFVLVVGTALVPASDTIELVRRRRKAGFLSMLTLQELARFAPIEAVNVPDSVAYLITGVDNGADSRNVTPDDALEAIHGRRRSPLTIEEGIALVTQFPEVVAPNGGFSLAGSRCGDRRVCALWISRGAPKLGWCWAGNPHTWLGTASCASRLSAHQGPSDIVS